MPTRAIVDLDGTPRAANAVVESTGELFPLTIGKSVAYRTSGQNRFKTTTTHNRSCAVEAFGAVKTVAGEFDAYRLKCLYDGAPRNVYYAPSIGRVVLQTADTILDSIKRELIAFERGSGKAARMTQGAPVAGAPKMAMRKKSVFIPPVGGNARYGVQLAAYRSPARVKRAWNRIKSKGGTLLDKYAPTIESHGKGGAALFRLIVGDFASKNKARAHCRALKRARIDCWPRARATTPGAPLAAVTAAEKVRRLVSR